MDMDKLYTKSELSATYQVKSSQSLIRMSIAHVYIYENTDKYMQIYKNKRSHTVLYKPPEC